jgi:hypothetical protein
MANQELTAAIQTTFTRSRGTYGAPRIHAELNSTGMTCSLDRIKSGSGTLHTWKLGKVGSTWLPYWISTLER